MACQITFGDRWVQLNNQQFSRLIYFAIETATLTALDEEAPFVDRMKKMCDELFWPGRGIEIEEDFPDIGERKFWCRMFLDTSRAIFDRTIGDHEYSFWQAQAIHQAYSTGLLFEFAIQSGEPRWYANTIDRREFDAIVNGT